MSYKIVNTDNFDGDYPNESFVGEEFETEDAAQQIADTMNIHDHQPRYFKVVKLPYSLQPGFEP